MGDLGIVAKHNDVERHCQSVEIDLESPRLILDHFAAHKATCVTLALERAAVDPAVDRAAPVYQTNSLYFAFLAECTVKVVYWK